MTKRRQKKIIISVSTYDDILLTILKIYFWGIYDIIKKT